MLWKELKFTMVYSVSKFCFEMEDNLGCIDNRRILQW